MRWRSHCWLVGVCAAVSVAGSSPAVADVTDGLVVWWTFSEGENGLQDRTVSQGIDDNNTYLSAVKGAAVVSGCGVLREATEAKFITWHAGANDELDYRDYPGITVWVRYKADDDHECGEFWWYGSIIVGKSFLPGLPAPRDLRIVVGDSTNQFHIEAPQLRTTDVVELAVTCDRATGQVSIYADAGDGMRKLFSEKRNPGLLDQIPPHEATPTIGNHPRSPNPVNRFAGEIDEVRIYRRALTQEELQNIEAVPNPTAPVAVKTAEEEPPALILAKDGQTPYRIVIQEDKPEVLAAAQELQLFLRRITRAHFSIVSDAMAAQPEEIIVGPSVRLEQLHVTVDWDELGEEGYTIKTVNDALVIVGGARRGTTNGVYGFLEDVLGCRWYSPDLSYIPAKGRLGIPSLDLQCVPPFEFRSLFLWSNTEPEWVARSRLNGFTDMGSIYGSHPLLVNNWHWAGQQVHTLGHGGLFPFALFQSHPEYFALIDGKRERKGQPCLTNPAVVKLVAANARNWHRGDPSARLISVSQGDFGRWCQCDRCREAYRELGTTGYLTRFVAQVADEVKEEFPDALVTTLAYQWTEAPPKDVHLPDNMLVRYAPISSCWYHSLAACPYNIQAKKLANMEEWTRIASRVWVWYYAQARNGLGVYPDMNAWSENFKLMRDAGIKGVFVQAKVQHRYLFLEGLRAYILAHLLWNPDYDVQQGVREWVAAMYGDAKDEMLQYVTLISHEDTYEGTPAGSTWLTPFAGFHIAGMAQGLRIEEKKLVELDELFDRAEQKVIRNDRDAFHRIKRQRLCVDYQILNQLDKDSPLWQEARRDFILWINTWEVRRFRHTVLQDGDLKDVNVTLEDYISDYLGGL